MAIKIGTQITAPAGFGPLRKSSVFYFLKSNPTTQQVLLIEYMLRKPKIGNNGKLQSPHPRVLLHRLPRSLFEQAITANDQSLIVASHQTTLPPWLSNLEGLNWEARNSAQSNPLSHAARIQKKLDTIAPAIARAEEVLNESDPDAALNRLAMQSTPKQNTSRFRFWFYTYLAFGRNPLALHYKIGQIGRWDRDSINGAKRGKPSDDGKDFGYNVDPSMREKILQGYAQHAQRSRTLLKVYRKTLSKQFGCKVISTNDEMCRMHQPEGKPIPSRRQFCYVIRQEHGKLELASDKIGPSRVRNELAPSAGVFSESVCNILERVEADGYFLKDLPKGLIEGSPLKKLVVVRMRCVASGMLPGIGFSLGGEKSSAYRMAMFCAAIDKVKFCSLFGVKISEVEWPGKGVPPYIIVDRGPASGLKALSNLEETMPNIRELAPTYAGQSKANIESTHPKTLRHSEEPEYIHSNHSAVELVRREIWRLLQDIDSINISDRLTPDLINAVRKPSPTALWKELEKRGRNDSIQIDFATAVRSFLTLRDATLQHNGLNLLGRRYDSPSLRASGALLRVSAGMDIKVKVYVMPACVRHIWIDIEGQLIELDLHLPLRVRNEEHFISLMDLEEWRLEEKRRTRAYEEHRMAKEEDTENRFEMENGRPWESGTRKRGRAPRGNRLGQLETSESKRDFG